MKSNTITKLTKNFEEHYNKENELEFWFARDLQILLGYEKWENFSKVIEKAKESCKNSKFNIQDHFFDVMKKVRLGSDVIMEIKEIMLTRYACYLIAQNGEYNITT